MRFALALAMLLTGCGAMEPLKPNKRNTVVEVGPFKPYLDLFIQEGAIHGRDIVVNDLIIKFEHIDEEKVLAVCRRTDNDALAPVIAVDPDKWAKLLLIQHEALIFHELGHCILKRDHLEGMSIMDPYLLSTKKIAENEAKLLAELFDPAQANTLSFNGEDVP